MNFGFKLAKPAESDIGIAMRLWQSNSASWRINGNSLSQRINNHIDHLSENKADVLSGLTGIEFVRMITNDVLRWSPYKDISYMYPREATIKQCLECSKVGYHSLYFMMPWLSHCPVHSKVLIINCPKCKQSLGGFSAIQLNKCPICSVTTSKVELVRLGAYDTERWKQAFLLLDRLFKDSQRPTLYWRTHLINRWNGRADEASRLQLLPSVLVAQEELHSQKNDLLVGLKIDLVDCYQFKFELGNAVSDAPEIDKFEISAMMQVRNNVLKRANHSISKLSTCDHQLNGCLDEKLLNKNSCLYCSLRMVIRWSQLGSEIRPNEVLFNVLLMNRTRLKFYDPGLVLDANNLALGHHSRIPLWVSKIIYFVDLWMLFRQIFTQIQHYSSQELPRESLPSYMQGRHPVLHSSTGPIAYCHLFLNRDRGELIFPKSYVSKNLTLDQKLLQMSKF